MTKTIRHAVAKRIDCRTPDEFLDAAGEACGTVTPAIKQSLSTLQPGQVLEALTHDPATLAGVPAWCRLTGHVLVSRRASRKDEARASGSAKFLNPRNPT